MGLRTRFRAALVLLALGVTACAFAESATILTNQLGYERRGPKRAVIRGGDGDHFAGFVVRSYPDDQIVAQGNARGGAAVDRWRQWRFWTLDFDALQAEGAYVIECRNGEGSLRSLPFRIQERILERNTLGNVVFYFKGQRSSGALDRADRRMTFLGEEKRPPVDVHGGWFDASGDYGKHLSHLANSTYHNPQQIPLVVYHLLKARDLLERRGDVNFAQDLRRMLDEALYGADYLVRVKVPGGSFYETVSNRGPAKKPEDRRITPVRRGPGGNAPAGGPGWPEAYEVSLRGGGGLAIAALALASGYPAEGEFSPADYLRAAEDAFAFLQQHNRELTNDGQENIVDDYCALMAATELWRATKKEAYLVAARERAELLLQRWMAAEGGLEYWRADAGTRPFFHAADAGLPVTALLYFREIADAPLQAKITSTIRRALTAELKLSAGVPNPFQLARQYVQSKTGGRRTAFFYPHDSDSAPWWQGENARLASLAAAARLAIPLFADDAAFQHQLRVHATAQLDWILGLNPFDACMLAGTGRNNPEYMFLGTYQYRNAPGGICNGITAALDDERGIAFDWATEVKGEDHTWRWGEQWLPHAAWYLLAVAAGVEGPATSVKPGPAIPKP